MTAQPDGTSSPAPMLALSEVAIVERPVDHPDAVRLLRAFYDEQVGRYAFAESVDLDPGEYTPPNGIFVVVYRHGHAVGCGCYLRLFNAAGYRPAPRYVPGRPPEINRAFTKSLTGLRSQPNGAASAG